MAVDGLAELGAWANSSVGEDLHGTLESLQGGLTVELIATKRTDFATCVADEAIADVVARNRLHRFDFLPVVQPQKDDLRRDTIVGLFEIRPFMNGALAEGRVRERLSALSEQNLIGGDAGILTLVRDADRHKCRLVVSGYEISGLVSQSDLQRLPVRAALFGMVTYLELIMVDAIHRKFGDSRDWMKYLNETRQEKLRTEIESAQQQDSLVDALLFTQFADKIAIICNIFIAELEDADVERDLKKIQKLRDHLAHANDYAASPDAADSACRTVRLIDKWSKQISELK
jgi:hypothetical protein